MICDKVIYGGQTILTIYHLGLDKDVPKRIIEKTEKIGRYSLKFIETFVEDKEIENIKDWVTKDEGIISPGKSFNPYGDSACAHVIHYCYLNKPSNIFKLQNNLFSLKLSVDEYISISEFVEKYMGMDIKTNPMFCGDIFVCKCYERRYSCNKENNIVFKNIPANSTIIVHFKKGKLIVSSIKTDIAEFKKELNIKSECIWDNHDVEIYHNGELVYYQNDAYYMRHVFLNTKIKEPAQIIKLSKIGTEYVIEKDSKGEVTQIGEPIEEYTQILTDSSSTINKQIQAENPDDKIFFIKPRELGKATKLIGEAIQSAKDEMWLFDSYFTDKNGISSILDWLRIIANYSSKEKHIVFCCSNPERALDINELICEIEKDSILKEMIRLKGDIGIYFYQAKSPIHDRFVLFKSGDTYGGINIGTSINSLERNHYCISKLSNSAAKIILCELKDWLYNGNIIDDKEV